MPNPHFSQAHESSLLTQWSLSVTIHLGALSNLDAETHIETTAGQLIRQPEDSGQRKTVKISYSQIFSSSIERGRQKFRDFERVFSSMFDIKCGVCGVLLMVILIAGPKPITVQFFFIYTILCIPHRGAIWGRLSRK